MEEAAGAARLRGIGGEAVDRHVRQLLQLPQARAPDLGMREEGPGARQPALLPPAHIAAIEDLLDVPPHGGNPEERDPQHGQERAGHHEHVVTDDLALEEDELEERLHVLEHRGDAVLRELVRVVREVDLPERLGGEFVGRTGDARGGGVGAVEAVVAPAGDEGAVGEGGGEGRGLRVHGSAPGCGGRHYRPLSTAGARTEGQSEFRCCASRVESAPGICGHGALRRSTLEALDPSL